MRQRPPPPFRLLAITPPGEIPGADVVAAWQDALAGSLSSVGTNASPRGGHRLDDSNEASARPIAAGRKAIDLAVLLRWPDAQLPEFVTALEHSSWRPFVRTCTEAGFPLLLSCHPSELRPTLVQRIRSPQNDEAALQLAGVQLRGDPDVTTLEHVRKRLGESAWLGRSVHGLPCPEPYQTDYACFAPVFAPQTRSAGRVKQAAGIEALERWTSAENVGPVFALGGVEPATAVACVRAGAYGLAGIRTFFGEPSRVREDVAALHDALNASRSAP